VTQKKNPALRRAICFAGIRGGAAAPSLRRTHHTCVSHFNYVLTRMVAF
jgi:hypothetical protein